MVETIIRILILCGDFIFEVKGGLISPLDQVLKAGAVRSLKAGMTLGRGAWCAETGHYEFMLSPWALSYLPWAS